MASVSCQSRQIETDPDDIKERAETGRKPDSKEGWKGGWMKGRI